MQAFIYWWLAISRDIAYTFNVSPDTGLLIWTIASVFIIAFAFRMFRAIAFGSLNKSAVAVQSQDGAPHVVRGNGFNASFIFIVITAIVVGCFFFYGGYVVVVWPPFTGF